VIGFLDCHKYYSTADGDRVVLFGASCLFDPLDRVSILAAAGSGKTTLVRLLAGLEAPTYGHVFRNPATSWPLGFAGAFHPALTGEENIRILSILCDVDADLTSDYVAQFSNLGDDYRRALSTYSAGMRARLAISFSLAVPAATYLADETIGTGDESFRLKCEAALQQRLRNAGLFLVTRNPRLAERFGRRHGVLRDGRVLMCDSFEQARSLFASQADEFTEIESIVTGFEAV
jgi:capsular polysaccharide transport system ATP-binding protein